MAIERTEFLQMCQKVSFLQEGIFKIKQNVPDELKLIYNNHTYYPEGYKISFSKGTPLHYAILHDITTNSITYAELEKVDKYEQTRSNSVDKTQQK
jgi:hypothetical protein